MWTSVARSAIASISRSLTSLMTLASWACSIRRSPRVQAARSSPPRRGHRVERVPAHAVVAADELVQLRPRRRGPARSSTRSAGGARRGRSARRGRLSRRSACRCDARSGRSSACRRAGRGGSRGPRGDGGGREINDGHVELVAQRVQHVIGGSPTQPDEDAVEPLTAAALLGDRRSSCSREISPCSARITPIPIADSVPLDRPVAKRSCSVGWAARAVGGYPG
jgi:hypothetical protein